MASSDILVRFITITLDQGFALILTSLLPCLTGLLTLKFLTWSYKRVPRNLVGQIETTIQDCRSPCTRILSRGVDQLFGELRAAKLWQPFLRSRLISSE